MIFSLFMVLCVTLFPKMFFDACVASTNGVYNARLYIWSALSIEHPRDGWQLVRSRERAGFNQWVTFVMRVWATRPMPRNHMWNMCDVRFCLCDYVNYTATHTHTQMQWRRMCRLRFMIVWFSKVFSSFFSVGQNNKHFRLIKKYKLLACIKSIHVCHSIRRCVLGRLPRRGWLRRNALFKQN